VVEINAATRRRLDEKFGVVVFEKIAPEAIEHSQIIVLAVKPQQIFDVARQLRSWVDGKIVLSIAAGIRLTDVAKQLGMKCTLVRAMPNLPALIGNGITGLTYYSFPPKSVLSQEKIRTIESITNAVGVSVWVKDENEMNAVTAVSGSGPAYVFLFMEALEQAAAELKLPKNIAHELVLQTFIGASRLAAQSADPLAALRERVTSKGGTTEAALASMARDQVREAIVRAVKAACERARQLGAELGKQ